MSLPQNTEAVTHRHGLDNEKKSRECDQGHSESKYFQKFGGIGFSLPPLMNKTCVRVLITALELTGRLQPNLTAE